MRSFSQIITACCLSLFLLALAACYKEKTLVADNIPDFYTLPQGNQPYDDSIVAFYKKYESYILYKFSQKDLTYDYSKILRVSATEANPACIDSTLKFLKAQCFDFYPDSFLKKTMPFKILLAASLDTLNGSGINDPSARSLTGFLATGNALAIGWVDTTLFNIPYSQRQMRGWLNGAYMKQALLSGALIIPDEFLKYIPGSYVSAIGSEKQNGILNPMIGINTTDLGPAWDFSVFVSVITSNKKADLDNTIFQPDYDVNGKVLLKYNAVIAYFKNEFGIDLQAIGEKD